MLAFILLLFWQETPQMPKTPPATVVQGERRLLDLSRVPEAGRAEDDFRPPGWRIETRYQGDLDGDGRPDTALQLVEDLPLENKDGVLNPRHRALLVLLRGPDGSLRRAAAATRLLYCSTCGGMLGDPEGGNISAEIKGGVLSVSQLSGSRWSSEHVWRFRREPGTGRFLLIGEDVNTDDRIEGSSTDTSTNYLTGVRVIKRTPKGDLRPRAASTRRTRVRPVRRFLEDVDYEAN